MSEEKSGGSMSIPLPGMNGGTANDLSQASEPPKAEDLPPQDAGKAVSPNPEKETPEVPNKEQKEETPDKPIFQKEALKAHEQVIDLLEEKFTQLKEGELDEETLKEWFVKNPSFADTANRSKRLKEDYRTLMEKPVEAQEERPSGEKPLTLKDLQQYDADREARVLAKAQERERDGQFTDFAVKYKVVDADAEQLRRNAEALYKANPEWDYPKAVSMAYATINPQKSSPVNISANSLKAPENKSARVDATQGIQLVSASKFSGGQLQD